MFKKSLKIPKWQSESVNRRMTDNNIAKMKRTNNDLQNITQRKLKIEQHEPTRINFSWLMLLTHLIKHSVMVIPLAQQRQMAFY